MTARELAAILMRHPDLPVHVLNEDYSRSDVTAAKTHLARQRPGGPVEPTAIELRVARPDWED